MKNFFTIAALLLCSVLSANADTTTDKVTVGSLSVNPGSQTATELTVSLEGSTTYSACQMQIYLPEGYSFTTNNKGKYTKLPSSDLYDETNHSVVSNVQTDGSIKLSISEAENEDMTAQSGKVVTLWIKANSWTKPGEAKINIKGIKFIKGDASQFKFADQEFSITTTTACTLPINVTAADKWGSLVSPIDVNAIPANITAYTITSVESDKVNLKKATKIEAYKSYILEASADVNTTVAGTVDASAYTSNVSGGIASASNADGIFTAQNITEGYVLQNKGTGCLLYSLPTAGLKVPAGKVVVKSSSSAKALNFVVEEDATVIDGIENGAKSNVIYDMQGRPVASPKHGVYIVGGKKVIM